VAKLGSLIGDLIAALFPSASISPASSTPAPAASSPAPASAIVAVVPLSAPAASPSPVARYAPRLQASDRDLDVATRTLLGEARGEVRVAGDLALYAVAWVIRNRAEIDLGNDGRADWWGEGIAGVCQAPWQFSCWNANDPNRVKLDAWSPLDPLYVRCELAARRVFAGEVPDPTGGATHYYAPKLVKAPAWSKAREPLAAIGGHVFYRVLD
jgi:spore germination cell wall hydrolase CwlJ-like protein